MKIFYDPNSVQQASEQNLDGLVSRKVSVQQGWGVNLNPFTKKAITTLSAGGDPPIFECSDCWVSFFFGMEIDFDAKVKFTFR